MRALVAFACILAIGSVFEIWLADKIGKRVAGELQFVNTQIEKAKR